MTPANHSKHKNTVYQSELEKVPGAESKSQLVLVVLRIGCQSDVIVFKPLTKRSSAKPKCELLWLSKRKPLLLLLHEQTSVLYTLVSAVLFYVLNTIGEANFCLSFCLLFCANLPAN